ncbi:chromosome segregation protein SMC [Bacillus coahuilensis p1.1.43]|uniref:Chromosome partition protein Smc n=1 Tax=Bacillus coahuilensis p1.1.43 TaxID=1150625 RepID=A0A147K9G7_9BACI|nr:chromosome segregation protein SMC [Bacillus coahuilensis]KUP07082.1 chromosome segregation protein SMC [Bacillus coahuilensis p1.1.43]
MFLKRLDIIGFKSFADRVNVEFVPGVTAVVGPNGSGKSNITESIRWVLGEQSAKSLRGSKMEDVIFAGSDSRKPLNFAEVTLTLDNEDQGLPLDYNEVSITRRVFRSGESDFLINNQSCRLKDIVDLIMDSGLGREAFSIISQGKVEEILNSKPEDRRTIFEEAAGVLKYKNRKKKAENKLFETQENLNRVQDILHELEGQVEPLKIQASMAKDFLEKKEELKNFEVALTVYEIEELHKEWEKTKAVVKEQSENELSLSNELQQKEAALIQKRDHLSALDESISTLQSILLTTSEELEKLEGRKEVLKERKKNASKNKEQLEQSKEELSSKIHALVTQKNTMEQTVQSLEQEVSKLRSSLKERNQLLESLNENIEEQIDSLKNDYIDLLNQQATARNEKQYLEQQSSTQFSRTSKLDSENEKFLIERKELKEKKKQAEEIVVDIQNKIGQQVSVYHEDKTRLDQLRKQFEEEESKLYQALQYIQQAKNKKEMLEDMEEGFAGFFQGVKEVLKARNTSLSGIEGAIAEIIQVEKKFQKAMETALSASQQHIVVQTEQDGRRAIDFLKKNAYGRATFLPLSVIKEKSIPTSVLSTLQQHESFVGVGNQLVSYDKKFAAVIANLLGNVLIAKDLRGANSIAKMINYRYRIVTLDGDVVNPGGSMTGGATKQKSSSLLSRKTEIDEMKEKISKMEESTALLQKQVVDKKDKILFLDKKVEESRVIGEQLRLQEQEKKGLVRELEVHEANLNEKLKIYDIEKKDYYQETERLTHRKQELEDLLKHLESELLLINQKIEELSLRKTDQISSRTEIMEEIGELKVALASKGEQFSITRKQLEIHLVEIAQTESKKDSIDEELTWLLNEMNGDSSGEMEIESRRNARREEKEQTLKHISERREERLLLQQDIDTLEIDVKEAKRHYRSLTVVLKDEEVKMNRLDVELDNRLNHLREEYFLSFEAAKMEFPLTLPVDEVRKRVKLTKLALDELGTVNIGAIEEYDRVRERYEFLLSQQTDLQDAKDTLYSVIDEMDEEMKKRFEWTFSSIREHFSPVFQALFGGGRADLRLTDPNDLLNTGVDIVAQPPGKKLQHLGLLSGGERALTAIALLFSILKVRPVPFCILDEVEAALDEANVHRFSSLKKYSNETQFIVITHRKGTMEEADVLYGVTMQESGVSKLVSVRLEETVSLVGHS